MPQSSSAVHQKSFRLFLLDSFVIERRLSQAKDAQKIISFHFPTHKIKSLLAYVVLHSGEKLATLFWGGFSDLQARSSLRNAFAVLRKHLLATLLIIMRDIAQLNKDFRLWTDADEFKKQSTTASLVAYYSSQAFSNVSCVADKQLPPFSAQRLRKMKTRTIYRSW